MFEVEKCTRNSVGVSGGSKTTEMEEKDGF